MVWTMSRPLTDTSYAVLGLLDRLGPSTPYQLKQAAQSGLFYFWSIPHTQIYMESARLAKVGLLEEDQEAGGRRRRIYSLTESGREAFVVWRDDPSTKPREIRDPALLKLFLGSDPIGLAGDQVRRHQQLLDSYLQLEAEDISAAGRRALEAGIGQEREYVRFWTQLAQPIEE